MIKNIFWDVDGVLVDLNRTYYKFLTSDVKFKDYFKDLKYIDLNIALPIDKKYGAMELSTHPTLGKELDKEFCKSNDYYFDREFYPHTVEVLTQLNDFGFTQIVMSAGFNIEKKTLLLKQIFKDLPFIKIVAVEHDKDGMSQGNTKGEKMLEVLKKLNLDINESVFVDDRIYNIYSAIKIGIKPIRFRSEFTTDLPDDLKNSVLEVNNIIQLRDWLLKKSK